MKILITGGAGYIGSTVASALEDRGHTPVILDSLVRGRREFTKGKIFYEGDIADQALLDKIFQEHPDITAAIHFAALIIVPESVSMPYEYYTENVAKSLELFKGLRRNGCKRVVFSSSASVYDTVPGYMVREDSPLRPTSPYARTKYMMEMILSDFCAAYDLRGIALRYFNPIGADPKMRSGIHIQDSTLVVARLVETALGRLEFFGITGTDYPTRDGTGLRDYIHVWDLAQAHVLGVEQFDAAFERTGEANQRYLVINLGTGKGVTVREVVAAFEKVWGSPINKRDMPRRPGDVPGAYANADTARRLLGWETRLSLEQAISDALQWGKIRETVLDYSAK